MYELTKERQQAFLKAANQIADKYERGEHEKYNPCAFCKLSTDDECSDCVYIWGTKGLTLNDARFPSSCYNLGYPPLEDIEGGIEKQQARGRWIRRVLIPRIAKYPTVEK